uniref:IMD domain-containing protein n=1 Tax=Strongyloides venezuelensis TaxID=75913 RepID=A0A0K0FB41_STRVS
MAHKQPSHIETLRKDKDVTMSSQEHDDHSKYLQRFQKSFTTRQDAAVAFLGVICDTYWEEMLNTCRLAVDNSRAKQS